MQDIYLFGITVAGMICSIAISWGMITARMAEHSKEIDELKNHSVRKDYLHAITDPLQQHIKEIQSDIKEILRAVSRNEAN